MPGYDKEAMEKRIADRKLATEKELLTRYKQEAERKSRENIPVDAFTMKELLIMAELARLDIVPSGEYSDSSAALWCVLCHIYRYEKY